MISGLKEFARLDILKKAPAFHFVLGSIADKAVVEDVFSSASGYYESKPCGSRPGVALFHRKSGSCIE